MSPGRAGLILEAEMYLMSCGLNLNPVLWLCLLRDRSRSIGPSLGDFRGRGGRGGELVSLGRSLSPLSSEMTATLAIVIATYNQISGAVRGRTSHDSAGRNSVKNLKCMTEINRTLNNNLSLSSG